MPVSYNYSLFDTPPATTPPETGDSAPHPKPATPPTTEEWTTTIRGLKNLTDSALEYRSIRPWEWDKEPPTEVLTDKTAFSAWSKRASTNHLFYTGMEGANPATRINKDNPVNTIHAIIADYDGVVTDENIDAISTKLSPDLIPTFSSRSRFSGGCRLVWMLETPLHVAAGNLADGFLQCAAKELRLKLLAAGFDEESLKPKQTFEVGTHWRRIGGPLRDATVHAWLFRAALRSKLSTEKEAIKIPIEAVAEEVEKQFPGRWSGNFEIGARGVVFFDPTSVNPTAAVVAEDGMVCFGQPKSFYPWSEILGKDFTRRYVEDMIAAATKGIYYDGTNAWMKRGGKTWTYYNSSDMMLYLTEGVKMSREGAVSALYAIKFANRIDAAMPYVGNHREIVINKQGERHLNLYTNSVMQPAGGVAGDWGDGFPWLAKFLETRVDKKVDPHGFSMWHLLAWLHEFYKGMYEGKPFVGQAIGICGGTSVGKTLFLSKVLAPAVGGSIDATGFLQGHTTFNSQLFESPLWVIDDGSFTADERGRKRCSEILKKCAATETMEINRKYAPAKPIVWNGRAVLLLNTDPDSILGIPSLSISNRDKFNLYKWVEKNPFTFPSRSEVESTIERELPYFLRWLLSYKYEEKGIEPDPRFGVKSYIESSTAEEAENSSGAGTFQEILVELVHQTGMTGVEPFTLVGLVGTINAVETLRPLMSRYTPTQAARQLRALASRSDPFLTRSDNGQWWILDCDKLRARAELPPSKTTVIDLADRG